MEGGVITIDEFARIDLRVGLVKKAERVPGSRKLIRLIVDLGGEERQILAGMGEFYGPEHFVGKRVVVVANLAPKKMMGYVSQGMVLAAGCGKGEKPVLLTVEEDVPPGSKIC